MEWTEGAAINRPLPDVLAALAMRGRVRRLHVQDLRLSKQHVEQSARA